MIPFTYPLRILGEVKYRSKPLSKSYVREYIGVIKDIQENYFTADGSNTDTLPERKMEIGVYFSANGFQPEAEKLAFAHGIKTISYQNNFLLKEIKNSIEELEASHLSVKCLSQDQWNEHKRYFIYSIKYSDYVSQATAPKGLPVEASQILSQINTSLRHINSSFIATTATGVFLHFLGEHRFPEELFKYGDDAHCRIFYHDENERNLSNRRSFYLVFREDPQQRRFYFTPPESLDQAAVHGGKAVLDAKRHVFRYLKVNTVINGIARNLVINLDQDWLDAIRVGTQR